MKIFTTIEMFTKKITCKNCNDFFFAQIVVPKFQTEFFIITYASVILTLTGISYIYLISIYIYNNGMDRAFNNFGEKIIVKVFSMAGCNFFFHGRLRARDIFRCIKNHWMFFLVPITARHVF